MPKKKSEYKIVAERRGNGIPVFKSKLWIPAACVAGVGTITTIVGIALYLANKPTKVVDLFHITLDANEEGELGGLDKLGFSKATYFKDINLPSVTPKSSTRQFNCWALDKEGTQAVQPNTNFNKDTTLYATYKNLDTYHKIIFKKGKEEVVLTGITEYDAVDGDAFGKYNKPKATIPSTAEREYTFLYWSTDGTEAGKISDDTIITKD